MSYIFDEFCKLFKIDECDNMTATFSKYSAKCIKGHFYRGEENAGNITSILKRLLQRFRYTGSRHIMDLDDPKSFYIKQYSVPMSAMKFGLIVGLETNEFARDFMHYITRVDAKFVSFRQLMKCHTYYPVVDGPTDTSFLSPDWGFNEIEILKLCYIEKFGKKSKYTQMISGVVNRLSKVLATKRIQRGNKIYPRMKSGVSTKTDKSSIVARDAYPNYLKNHFVEDSRLNSDFREVLNREILIKLLQN